METIRRVRERELELLKGDAFLLIAQVTPKPKP